jgi:hypothetical protein
MANLRDFIWSGSHDGMPVDIYLNRTPMIGSGVLLIAQSLHLSFKGEAVVFGKRVAGTVEIMMPSNSPSGTCTVVLNGVSHYGCGFRVDGTYLKIQVAGRELTLGAQDKQWTWISASGVPAWFGLWPSSQAMEAGEAERGMEALPA